MAVVHNLDMPIMSQSGIPISPGNDVQIAVRPSLTDITNDARLRYEDLGSFKQLLKIFFYPKEKRCFDDLGHDTLI